MKQRAQTITAVAGNIYPFIIALGLAGCGDDPAMEASRSVSSDLMKENATALWLNSPHNRLVPVCWTPYATDGYQFSAERAEIQWIVDSQWTANANLRFDWKGICPPNASNMYKIRIHDTGSYYGGKMCTGQVLTCSDPDVPSNACNGTSCNGHLDMVRGPVQPTGKWLVLHEFGHVLGFSHEHNRDEAATVDPNCYQDDVDPYGVYTSYDLSSVMRSQEPSRPNCTIAYNPFISNGDIEGAGLAYGRRWTSMSYAPSGSFYRGLVATDYLVYAVSGGFGTKSIYYNIGTAWISFGRPLSIGYVTNANNIFSREPGATYRWDGSTWVIQSYDVNRMYAGADKFVVVNPDGTTWWRQDGVAQWNYFTSNPYTVAFTTDYIYVVSADQMSISSFHPPTGQWSNVTSLGGAVKGLIARGSKLYATRQDTGNIYKYTCGTLCSWILAGGPGAEHVLTPDGRLFGLSPDRLSVWKYLGSGASWVLELGPADALAATSSKLHVRRPDNEIRQLLNE